MLPTYSTRSFAISAVLLAWLVGAPGIASGQSTDKRVAPASAADVGSSPTRQRAPVTCTDVDPLIGDWEVIDARGNVTADSQFKGLNNNCALVQTYTPRNGRRSATCLIAYDSRSRDWMIWVAWDGGTRSQYTHGVLLRNISHDGLVANELRFDAVGARGALQHLAFFTMPDGTLREWQESSIDGGRTWKENFDRIWRRRRLEGDLGPEANR